MTAQPSPHFALTETLTATVEERGSSVQLAMEGEIDLATVHQVMANVNRVDLNRITALVIDLGRVTFLDLAGLHAILRINEDCKDHAVHLTVIAPRCAASRVFTLTRAHRELNLG